MTASSTEEREHPSPVLAPSGPSCGTVPGHRAHVARGEHPCAECAGAHERRRTYQRAYDAARQRALSQLAARHRAEYAQLLAAEQAKGASR